MDFNRNLRIVRTSGSSYPFPYKNNVLWVHHDENNNPIAEIWDHGKWAPITVTGSGSGDIIIDTKMSDSSSNAIANKTVKKYIDGVASEADEKFQTKESAAEADHRVQSLIDTLNPGYQFMDVATPETNPGTPDQKVFYIANGKGTYTNFGGINVTEDDVVVLYYDTEWHKVSTGIASRMHVENLEQFSVVKSPGVNLLDPNDRNVKIGYYLTENTLRADSSYCTSGYIPVAPGTIYAPSFEMTLLRFVSFYDEDYNYLSNTQNTTSFTTPANCRFIRVSGYSNEWRYAHVSQGERTNYQKYSPIEGYLPEGYADMLIELKGFGNFGPGAGVTQNGECFYNTDTKQILEAVNFDSNRYRVIPFYPGAIYSYGGNFYVWNGTDLVKAPADLQTLKGTVSDLSQVVAEFGATLDDLENTIEPVLENPLKGVSFGTSTPQSIREAITKVWIESSEPGNIDKVILNAPTLYIYSIWNDVGDYRPIISISPTLDNQGQAFSWYLSSQDAPRTEKEVVRAICKDPYFTNWGLSVVRAYICIEIDWSKISGRNQTQIVLTTAELQRHEVEKVSLSAVKSSIVQNSLFGKTIVCFGDSITELNDTNGFRYSDYLKDFSDANVINVGIGGSAIRQRTELAEIPTSGSQAYAALDVVSLVEACIKQDFSKQIAAVEYLRDHASDDNTAIVARLQGIDWANVDVVTFFAGTNDWYSGQQIGTHGSVDKFTTLGAINYIIQNFLTTYPHVKIYWFTPIVRWINYSGGAGASENWGGNYVAGKHTLQQFVDLIKNEVSAYNLPICDLYNTLGWNMYNFSYYFPDNDGTHPNKPSGMKGIGARFAAFIQANKNL